ncbi:aminotransferase class III-fold pyridoxal phosphate-dependent enzyme, partial [Micromonospora sp. DH15]|nr:aminotransferase class III-fold pyridoxal phosphate-dependent enzyme [Micromonospora sp. DH15]
VFATNSTLARDGLAPADRERGGLAGGLSGRPLAARDRAVVSFVHRESGGGLPVFGVGGIVDPDVLCVGKALTGGYLTLAAALCTADVAAGISRDGVLAHGPTFMANPLACAVANASIGLLRAGDWAAEVSRVGAALRAGLEPLRGAPGVTDVRVLGAIGVVQLDHEVDLAAATAAAVDRGVWLRPFRDLVYAMPPYVADDADVARIAAGMAAAVAAG